MLMNSTGLTSMTFPGIFLEKMFIRIIGDVIQVSGQPILAGAPDGKFRLLKKLWRIDEEVPLTFLYPQLRVVRSSSSLKYPSPFELTRLPDVYCPSQSVLRKLCHWHTHEVS